jgi:hypothetical protein
MDSSKGPSEKEAKYASIFWCVEETQKPNEKLVVVGYSFPDDKKGKGAWDFKYKYESDLTTDGYTSLEYVEEPIGIMVPLLSKTETGVNESLERLIADQIMIFIHRALFGQFTEAFELIDPKIPPVDIVLVYGPLLPKLVGRICYTHFTRNKTVSIIAPDTKPGKSPRQEMDWEIEPMPALWDDHSIRRWSLKVGATSKAEDSSPVCAFDLIIPVGDAVVGKSIHGNAAGDLWIKRATCVKKIMKNPVTIVKSPYWNNEELFLPKGMALAIQQAFCRRSEIKGTLEKNKICHENNIYPNKREKSDVFMLNVWELISSEVNKNRVGPDAIDPMLVSAIICRTWYANKDTFIKFRKAAVATLSNGRRVARQTGEIPSELKEMIVRAVRLSIAELQKEEIGEFSER